MIGYLPQLGLHINPERISDDASPFVVFVNKQSLVSRIHPLQ